MSMMCAATSSSTSTSKSISSDTLLFVGSILLMGITSRLYSRQRTTHQTTTPGQYHGDNSDDNDMICLVDEDNRILHHHMPTSDAFHHQQAGDSQQSLNNTSASPWYRSTYLLIIHEPPHMFYEPKEWAWTHVLLEKRKISSETSPSSSETSSSVVYSLPGGPVLLNADMQDRYKKDDHINSPQDEDQQQHHYFAYLNAALRQLRHQYGIDACEPHNCLHHLFTFPFPFDKNKDIGSGQDEKLDYSKPSSGSSYGGVWGDFYECVYRGETPMKIKNKTWADDDDCGECLSLDSPSFELFTLSELKEMLDDDVLNMDAVSGTKSSMATSVQCQQQQAFFKDDTRHALRLFFQQQHDLRARRRLLKGYSSADLQKYGLRSEQQQYGQTSTALNSNRRLVLSHAESSSDFLDQKQEAVEYTMRTDDGMAPHLLYKADVILLGVSRAGKTPLSIYMAQTLGLKVANIPLVLELPPPSQLTDRGRVDPRRVFCLTLQSEFLERFRKNRFSSTGGRAIDIGGSFSSKRNECSIQDNVTTTDINSRGSTTSIGGFRGLYSKDKKFSYSQSDYVERDLEHARSLAREYGYTELDVTGRAMEETSSLIVSKLKERFPDTYITL